MAAEAPTGLFWWFGLTISLRHAAASLVQSSTGPCVVNGNCVCSSNYLGTTCEASSSESGTYGSSEACEVTFVQAVQLSVHLFEFEYDTYLPYCETCTDTCRFSRDGECDAISKGLLYNCYAYTIGTVTGYASIVW